MFRLPAIRIGRLFGIPIEIDLSWLLVFGIVGWTLSTGYYPSSFPGRPLAVDAVSGILTAVLFFTSLLTHEFSHSLVAVRSGTRVERVTLFLFGAIAQLADEPRSPGTELRMALAGPGMSLMLSGVFYALYRLLVDLGMSDVIWAPVMTLSAVNLTVALFNMAPGFPMDGGRVLRAFLWWATGDRRSATSAASLAGQGLGLAIAGLGAWALVERQLEGVWFIAMGLFLRLLARSAYIGQEGAMWIAGTPVSDVMISPVPVRQASHDGLPHSSRSQAPIDERIVAVVEAGRLIGISRPGDGGAEAPPAGMLVDAREAVETAVRRFSETAFDALLVVSDSRVVGYLTRSAMRERIAALHGGAGSSLRKRVRGGPGRRAGDSRIPPGVARR